MLFLRSAWARYCFAIILLKQYGTYAYAKEFQPPTNQMKEGKKATTTTAQVTDVKWFMFLDGARKIHWRIAHRRNKLNSSFLVCLCMCAIFLLLHAFIVGIWNMGYFVSLPLHDYSVENVELGIRACMWTRNNWNS